MKLIENPTNIEKRNACIEITKQLPLWFGQEKANIQYAKDAFDMPSLLIKNANGDNIALLVYKIIFEKQLNQKVLDIHWLGIMPEYHRKGLGSKLAQKVSLIATENNIEIITVETLDPEMKDECYLKSYAFYVNFGFKTFHKFSYDSKNHMVKMKKSII